MDVPVTIGAWGLTHKVKELLHEQPSLTDVRRKLRNDKIGVLAGYVSWSILTSIVPLVAGAVAISGLLLQSASARHDIVQHLSQMLQGAFATRDIDHIARAASQHAGLFGLIGVLGVFWGGSMVGGSIATAFQPIFQAKSRNFIRERLIDIGMIFVFAALMILILLGTTAAAFLNKLDAVFPLPASVQVIIGTAISFTAAFLLFGAISTVFPNTEPHYNLKNVWLGSLLPAVLFEIVSYMWPLYVGVSHVSRYGVVIYRYLPIYVHAKVSVVDDEWFSVDSANLNGRSLGLSNGTSPGPHRALMSYTRERHAS